MEVTFKYEEWETSCHIEKDFLRLLLISYKLKSKAETTYFTYITLIAPVIDYLELPSLIPDVGEEVDFECETVENDPLMAVDENDEGGRGVFLTCN